jgi:ABC-type multidrug transport system fused ATPase/permease subunit
MKISAGEKLALIGLNGAGKTTLVKLICGLYEPTEGMVLLNGYPRESFTKEEYLSLVAVLFQDATFLPKTLDNNILSGNHCDKERFDKVLMLSGFKGKYDSLSKKGDTLLVKKVESEATDFSGGEKQKLLCARTLYKKTPLVILDEPTAALDPIAENELYMNLSEAMEGRSVLYISHRLSSTRFCDRILLIEHGKIVEEGTHESLMQKNARYAELYEMQSKYYKEDEKRKNRSKAFGEEYVELQKGAEFNE